MPVYLVHGFRWPREGFSGIRVHAIVNNLDNTSVEYIQNENSRADILDSFHRLYPDIMKELVGGGPGGRNLEFIEQYNPDDVDGPNSVSQPYAYVGDKVVTIAGRTPGSSNGGGSNAAPLVSTTSNLTPTTHPSVATTQGQNTDTSTARGEKESGSGNNNSQSATTSSSPHRSRANTQHSGGKKPGPEETDLSLNVEDVIAAGPGLTNKAWEALADLRDKIAPNEKIGWWVVYNGDPERAFDEDDEDEDYDDDGDEEHDYDDDDDQGQELADDERGADPKTAPSPRRKQGQGQPHSRGSSQQLRPLTGSTGSPARPRTAPSAGASDAYPPPLPLPLSATSPRVSHQQQPSGLTALPVRPTNVAEQTSKPDTKGKQKEGGQETKSKEMSKGQSFRKKLFGRRG
ncbi:uncharacterized protein PV06_10234 [Exophiala oligosperma]|uniref:Uncharacterized protein n=2 Tax=Chaetothyriales TaxID=34395 RepID=A0A0D2D5G1_9EURO|nr:uncharacterized protein PV06_10234 [Exophiala oligosperma]KAJ9617709.1 hypothetical protein H2204_013521 [Knufia peltigerae]KIW37590.1 hypothetical protein PV06_10234 [Exophiala oligosperma]